MTKTLQFFGFGQYMIQLFWPEGSVSWPKKDWQLFLTFYVGEDKEISKFYQLNYRKLVRFSLLLVASEAPSNFQENFNLLRQTVAIFCIKMSIKKNYSKHFSPKDPTLNRKKSISNFTHLIILILINTFQYFNYAFLFLSPVVLTLKKS